MKLIVDIPDMAYEAYKEWHKQGVSNVEQSLIALAMPYEERPQGEWIDYDNTFYKCPECGYLLGKCCPHCQNKVILPKGGADEPQ